MRILHIETGRHLYGGALQVVYLLRGLADGPFDSLLVCPTAGRIAHAAAPYADIRAVPLRGDLDPLFPLRLWRIIKADRPSLIHVHSRRGADFWGAALARISGIPAVVTRRVDNPEASGPARVKYRCYAHVVAISEGIRRVLLSEGIPAAKITTIPSAVDYPKYSRLCRRQWLNDQAGLEPGDRLVGMVAQLIPRKGHRYLLQAAPAILAEIPRVKFLLFGRGPMAADIQHQIRQIGLEKNILMMGFREDLADWLPCLEAVVHPAVMEGLGVSLLQAGAARIPVVATHAGGIPEIVIHGVTGYLFDRGDTAAIARYVVEVLSDAGKAKQFGRAAQQRVRQRFSIEAMVAAYTSLYGQVAGIKAIKK